MVARLCSRKELSIPFRYKLTSFLQVITDALFGYTIHLRNVEREGYAIDGTNERVKLSQRDLYQVSQAEPVGTE